MKSTLKTKYRKAKGFVGRHKEAFIVGGVALIAISLQKNAIQDLNEFITEKGLAGEYLERIEEG
jgi:hypothetical protein